jgi:DNA-binding response OmpR family regulator
MTTAHILWVDDEIDLLKPHLIFLRQKGYEVDTVSNGHDAIEQVEETAYDLVFLDENMPGIDGLETLRQIKEIRRSMPVVMVTKSEEEHIMEEAIGGQIADYLIKPVNPNQLLLSLKKNLDERRLVNEKTSMNYQQEFRKIGMELNSVNSWDEWVEMYKKLTFWELELEKLDDNSLEEILVMQKREANNLFSRFVDDTYLEWMEGQDAPLMSHTLFNKKVFPAVKEAKSTFVILIDNLRYDQWKVIQPEIQKHFRLVNEDMFSSILPTATQYARNAMFAGLMPSEIKRRFPDKWKDENDQESKNQFESDFLADNLRRAGISDMKYSYNKVVQQQYGKKLLDQVKDLSNRPLNVIVYNFVDMLSHAKTEMDMIKELADNDRAYRSLTLSWFVNSSLSEMVRRIAQEGARLIVTTDHGTINVNQPSKLIGERSLNSNLRYKVGRNMSYEEKDVLVAKNPSALHLPASGGSSFFVFARDDRFFAYPNNYNHYVKYYRNTFQHGGISMEEMIIPCAVLDPR